MGLSCWPCLRPKLRNNMVSTNNKNVVKGNFCILFSLDAASTITNKSKCQLDICTQINNCLFHEGPANNEDTLQWKKVQYSRKLLRNVLFQLKSSISHCQCREGDCFKLDTIKSPWIDHVRLFNKRRNYFLFKQNTKWNYKCQQSELYPIS